MSLPVPVNYGTSYSKTEKLNYSCSNKLYTLPIHELKKGVMWTLIYPLDRSQDSTAILQADSLAACPD